MNDTLWRDIPGRGAPLAPPTCFSQGRVMKSTCSSATLLSTFTFPNGKGTTYIYVPSTL